MVNVFKEKKGIIGETLTWVFATLAIFFIILLFISATGVLAAGKSIPIVSWVLGFGKNTISLEGAPSLSAQKDFLNLLALPVGTTNGVVSLRERFSSFLSLDSGAIQAGRDGLVGDIKNQLNLGCSEFMIVLPNGAIYRNKDSIIWIDESKVIDAYKNKFSYSSILIPVKEGNVEISYWEAQGGCNVK